MKSIRAERPLAAATLDRPAPAGTTTPAPTLTPTLTPTSTAARPPRPIAITVIGTGPVGLVAAACFARFGHRVTAFDTDAGRIDRLGRGELVLHEAGLHGLMREQLACGSLRLTAEADDALADAELVVVAVGTPARGDGSADLAAIDRVCEQLRGASATLRAVVLKSTVPVGTAQRLAARLADDAGPGERAPRVLSCPEFLREGTAVDDFMKPDRLIIGDDHPDGPARRLLLRAHAPLVDAGVAVLVMDTRSAELAKCAANAMLAARISFINEIAAIASATGADIEQVCEGIGSDHRIGREGLRAGLGYGGSCFPKDVAALRDTARRSNLRADMLLAVERVNNRQRSWAFDTLQKDIGSRAALRGLRVALWGLAFKPGTDDMREAPSLALIDRLWRAGVAISAYDPAAMANARACVGDNHRVTWAPSAEAALDGADVLVLVTEWPEFVAFGPARVAAALALRTVYDGRNALDAPAWTAAGLRLVQVGRPETSGRAPVSQGVARTTTLRLNDLALACQAHAAMP